VRRPVSPAASVCDALRGTARVRNLAAACWPWPAGLTLFTWPNLPAREIVAAAERTSPQAVVLGIKTSEPDPVTIEELRLVASKLPKRTELWLGGSEVRKPCPPFAEGACSSWRTLESWMCIWPG